MSIAFVLILTSAARVDFLAFFHITLPTTYLYAFLIFYVHAVWPLRLIILVLMPPIIRGLEL